MPGKRICPPILSRCSSNKSPRYRRAGSEAALGHAADGKGHGRRGPGDRPAAEDQAAGADPRLAPDRARPRKPSIIRSKTPPSRQPKKRFVTVECRGNSVGSARHRRPVVGTCRMALNTFRASVSRGRPTRPCLGTGGSIGAHSSSVASLSPPRRRACTSPEWFRSRTCAPPGLVSRPTRKTACRDHSTLMDRALGRNARRRAARRARRGRPPGPRGPGPSRPRSRPGRGRRRRSAVRRAG